MVFREGRTKAVGSVFKCFPHVSGQAEKHQGRKAYNAQQAAAKKQNGTRCLREYTRKMKLIATPTRKTKFSKRGSFFFDDCKRRHQ